MLFRGGSRDARESQGAAVGRERQGGELRLFANKQIETKLKKADKAQAQAHMKTNKCETKVNKPTKHKGMYANSM